MFGSGNTKAAWWLAAALAGSAVRSWFGQHYLSWNAAPDQLAWSMVLADAAAHGLDGYHQLIHYPHEGGSLLLSLLAFLFAPFATVLPPLSWAALLADTISRFVQIAVSERLFGTRTAAWFAGWTILGVPILLPWATVNFGLHALVAFVPFVLVRAATAAVLSPWKVGVLTGLFLCLSYDALVFVPAIVLWLGFRSGPIPVRAKNVALVLGGFMVGALPHLLLRTLFDNAFHLEALSPVSVRGLDWSAIPIADLHSRAWATLNTSLPASLLLASSEWASPRTLAYIVLGFILTGIAAVYVSKKEDHGAPTLMSMAVLFFCLLYAASPLFVDRVDITAPVLYRHFAFIVPLLALLVIHGFLRHGRAGAILTALWSLLCASASIAHMADQQQNERPSDRAAGWVLARKYGHDPVRLQRIASMAPPDARNEVLIGYGWGITAVLLEGRRADDTAAVNALHGTLLRFDRGDSALLDEGMRFAFSPGITPVLDAGLLERAVR